MEGLYTFVYVTAMRGKYRIGEGKSELDSWRVAFGGDEKATLLSF